jgi:hypothetical protein
LSWDLFVQDLPKSAVAVSDIPADFVPGPLCDRASALAAILEAVPFADFSDSSWIRVNSPKVELEINLGSGDPVFGFAFHIRGGTEAIGLVAAILSKLGLRALDPGAEGGIFDPATASESLRRWQAYREKVLFTGSPN